MLNTLFLAAALAVPQAAAPVSPAMPATAGKLAGALVLAKGGPDRRDPFAELKEKKRREAEEKGKAKPKMAD